MHLIEMSSKHRRTRSSNDLHNLLNTSNDRRLIKMTSLSPSSQEVNIVKLVKASADLSPQKIVCIQNLEANFAKTHHLTELQFGKSTLNKSRRQWSVAQQLALFSIPEGNSTLDTLTPQSPKDPKKASAKKNIRITKKTLNPKPTLQRAKSKEQRTLFKKANPIKIASIGSGLTVKLKTSKVTETPTPAPLLKKRGIKSYF